MINSITRTALMLAIAGTAQVAHAEELVAVTRPATGPQALVGLDSQNPAAPLFVRPITGVADGLLINGLDYRPADRLLYALASPEEFDGSSPTSQLYTIDVATGEATPIGGPVDPGLQIDNVNAPTYVGFDFNPVVDLMRAISSQDQNIVVNPTTGLLVVTATSVFYGDGDVNEGIAPTIAHIAYTNSNPCTDTTQQYGIDVGLDILTTVANNAGTLGTVGPLGIDGPLGLTVDVKGQGGFDISGDTGTAYALLTVELLDSLGLPVDVETQSLYTIDLATGEATELGFAGTGLLNLDALTTMPVETSCCGEADIAAPFGVLNNTDVNAFVNAFLNQQPEADCNGDGLFNNTDINCFVSAFTAGCAG